MLNDIEWNCGPVFLRSKRLKAYQSKDCKVQLSLKEIVSFILATDWLNTITGISNNAKKTSFLSSIDLTFTVISIPIDIV